MEMHTSSSLLRVHGIESQPARLGTFGLVTCISRVFQSLAEKFARRRRFQRDIRELQRLDDRMLADIGMRRSEIERMVRRGR